mgnify:CR=1 FL=1
MKHVPGINSPVLPGVVLLVLSIVLGLCVYQHYGVSWDEPWQREIGETSYRYVFENNEALLIYQERDHGVGFELPLILIEKALQPRDISDVYLMRHLVTHLFFLISAFCGYLLALRLFGNKWIASLAFLMFVLHPRLYAHSFFNSKDIPFLSMFIVCFFLAEVAFRKNDWRWHLLLGIACGYTTSIRILALLLVFSCLLFYSIDLVSSYNRRGEWQKSGRYGLVFLSSSLLTLYSSWPVLWRDPITTLFQNFESMSHFRWDGTMLFFGEVIRSTNLPWTYVPGWFSITVPPLWLAAGVAAIALTIYLLIKQPKSYLGNGRERNYLLYLICTVLPVALVILLNSVVLDDWRHLYFIYPGFVFLALSILNRAKSRRIRSLVLIMCAIQLADIAWFMIRNHPHQQVYFNRLVSHNDEYLRMNFELDYWGASCRQGLEYLLANDPSSTIKVYASGWQSAPIVNNTYILNAAQRSRIHLVPNTDEADYFLTNFRWHPDDYPLPKLVNDVQVLNSSILHVYKLRE